MKPPGRVSLVGAGPGDPDLITLRGLGALRRADVVLYDRLVSPETLEFAREDAELVDVGKRSGGRSVTQEEVNRLLVDHAASGRRVVRLKSGDPFVFGRGGEEIEALTAAGIPYEVIPGVTAALGAGAYAELPLTVRGLSSSVTLVTGHEDPTKDSSDLDWGALARSGSTLVIYMAVANLREVASKLIASGLPPETPAAVVTRATMPDQVSLAAPLEDLPDLVRERGLAPPSVVVIGRVVRLDRRGGWFEALPWLGRGVVVATADSPEDTLVRGLSDLGARVYRITQADAADRPTRQALDAITGGRASLLVFTSPTGVRALAGRLPPRQIEDARRIPAAALGGATARVAREAGFTIEAGSGDESVEALLQEIRERPEGADLQGPSSD